MQQFLMLIGRNGVLLLIGIIFFVYSYKNSVKLFQWIEDQTYGTKDFIMKKLEFLHIHIKEQFVVIGLLVVAFGIPLIILGIFILLGNFIFGAVLAILVGVAGWKIPRPLMNYLVAKRIEKYQAQLVDGLNLLTNGIRAGLSLPQGLAMVVAEMPPPISQEYNIILQQSRIGSPLEECFEDLVKRVPTEDNQMFVSSINILRETGGNLAETFDTIVSVIRERIRLQQKINTATAQGVLQGFTIFCMPFVMGAIFFVSDPKSMGPMFTHPLGIVILIVALGLDLIGGYFIMKVVKIKV
ncbi:MAG: type II secretion system F family protein [Oligoflexia bacterium]|nr:type II secretion system F family protein [Oligoflexia bacterium]